jgi:hypothetical protein
VLGARLAGLSPVKFRLYDKVDKAFILYTEKLTPRNALKSKKESQGGGGGRQAGGCGWVLDLANTRGGASNFFLPAPRLYDAFGFLRFAVGALLRLLVAAADVQVVR